MNQFIQPLFIEDTFLLNLLLHRVVVVIELRVHGMDLHAQFSAVKAIKDLVVLLPGPGFPHADAVSVHHPKYLLIKHALVED